MLTRLSHVLGTQATCLIPCLIAYSDFSALSLSLLKTTRARVSVGVAMFAVSSAETIFPHSCVQQDVVRVPVC